jgi:hypothetical protein
LGRGDSNRMKERVKQGYLVTFRIYTVDQMNTTFFWKISKEEKTCKQLGLITAENYVHMLLNTSYCSGPFLLCIVGNFS